MKMKTDNKPRRILFLLPVLPHYRNEFFKLLRSELGRNYRLMVAYGRSQNNKKPIYHKPTDKFDSLGCRSRLISILKYRIVWMSGVLSLLRRYSPDIVIILFNYGVVSFWLTILYCKLRRVPVAFWGCGHRRPEIQGFRSVIREELAHWVLKSASAHICYGSKFAAELKRNGIPPNKVFIAQNTIDVDRILSSEYKSREYYREMLGIDREDIVFLYVGAIIKNKNLDAAIRAIDELFRTGHNVRFYIVGEGEEKARLQRAVQELDRQLPIEFVGAKYGNDLVPYFLAADAFLLPGTGGLAINEAMAYGLPILSTEGDGTVHDLLKNDINGYMLNNSLDNLMDELRHFIKLPLEQRLKMSYSSKEIIFNTARLQRMVEGFVSVIHQNEKHP